MLRDRQERILKSRSIIEKYSDIGMNTLQLLKYPSNRKNETFWSALIVIVLIAAFFRFSGLHWDEGFPYTPHPDERAILMKSREIEMPPLSKLGTLFNADESTWNPRWFPYGSFPLYVLEISENILERMTGTDITDLRILARSISVLADLGTIIGIAMLGKAAFSRRVGILAALLVSFSVIHIQLAHFFAFDTLIVFFTTWSLLVLYRLTFSGKISHSLLAGALIGLGLATKVSLLPIAGAFVMAHLIYAARDQTLEDVQYWKVKKALISAAWGIVAGSLIFVLAQPYALLDWNRFIGDVTEQSEMVRRIRDYPYTRQYIGTTPYVYQFIQMGKWGLGWPLTIISIVGLFWAASKGLKLVPAILSILCCAIIPALILLWNNSAPAIVVSSLICFFSLLLFSPFRGKGASILILLLSWVLPYLLVTGSFEVKFPRYLLPAIPVITLLGAAFVIHCFNRSPRYSQISSACLILLTVIVTVWYGLSMMGIYGEKHTAVKASEWLAEYGKSGSLIIKEHWEESLPNLRNFQYEELPIYEDDTYVKLTRISDSLQRGDYLVFFSNRLYGTVTRIEDRYPIMKGYYSALFTGKLGYEPVLIQTSYLSLFGINLIEDTFDRPVVPDPTKRLMPPPDKAGIQIGFADESFSVYDHPKVMIFENRERLSATEIRTEIESEAISRSALNKLEPRSPPKDLMMDEELLLSQRSGGTWSGIINKDSITSRFPVATWLAIIELISLCALPLSFFVFRGLLARGYLLAKILGLLLTCFLAWLLSSLQLMKFEDTTVWVSLGALTLISSSVLYFRRVEILSFLRIRWKRLVILECVFLLAFFSFLLIRMANPDLWHPYRGGEKPMDMAYLNAVLRSSYMPPYDPWFSGGYMNYYYWGQFIVASLIHMSGITTEVAYNLAIPTLFAFTAGAAFTIGSNLVGRTSLNLSSRTKIIPFAAGMSGLIFVCVIGNLDGFFQSFGILSDRIFNGISGGEFDYWRSSRMMPPDPPGHEITEFPFFTFLFADLHAHLIALPFTLLVIGTSMSIILSSRGRIPGKVEDTARLLLLGLSLGSLRAINTWDLPTYVFISVGSVGIGQFVRHGGINLSVIYKTGLKSMLVLTVAFIAFIPYHLTTVTYFSGIEATTNMTTFNQLVSINGLFLFLIASGSIYLLRAKFGTLLSGLRWLGRGTLNPRVLSSTEICLSLILLLALGYIVTALLKGFLGGALPVSIFLMILVIAAAFRKCRQEMNEQPVLLFASLMAAGGLSIIAFLEIWRIEGDIDRMNSVFKFYTQAWVLLALASVYFLYRIIPTIRNTSSLIKFPLIGLASVLVLAGLIYPVMGTRDRLRDRFNGNVTPLTLNGYAYLEGTTYSDIKGAIDLGSDFEGIKWLRENVKGSPVIVEGITPTYRWGGRVSVHTGLPTVVGWKWHQEQQRWGMKHLVSSRQEDVNSIYSLPTAAAELIDKYEVEYVYIGELERLYYPNDSLEKLTQGLNGKLSRVFESDSVIILKVSR